MRTLSFSAVLLTAIVMTTPSQAYQGLEADYKTCTTGAGKVSNKNIVGSCSRLIKNAAKKNELVGYFHALRASANTDKRLNCQDAKAAFQLLSKPKLKKLARDMANANC